MEDHLPGLVLVLTEVLMISHVARPTQLVSLMVHVTTPLNSPVLLVRVQEISQDHAEDHLPGLVLVLMDDLMISHVPSPTQLVLSQPQSLLGQLVLSVTKLVPVQNKPEETLLPVHHSELPQVSITNLVVLQPMLLYGVLVHEVTKLVPVQKQ